MLGGNELPTLCLDRSVPFSLQPEDVQDGLYSPGLSVALTSYWGTQTVPVSFKSSMEPYIPRISACPCPRPLQQILLYHLGGHM